MGSLSDFRVGEPESPWKDIAPIQCDLTARVMSFDQSLGSTGWVIIDFRPGGFDIQEAGMVTTRPVDGGTIAEDNYSRGFEIRSGIRSALERAGAGDVLVVIEMPPLNARHLKQTTSPFLAGFIIYEEATLRDWPVSIIQAQKAKRRWTGLASAAKRDVRRALTMQFRQVADMKPLNEHTTDAVLLALTAIEEVD